MTRIERTAALRTGIALLSAAIALSLAPVSAPRASEPAEAASPQDANALTGKERLGKKWTDDQRIDNCRVPIGQRGAAPRPDACRAEPPQN